MTVIIISLLLLVSLLPLLTFTDHVGIVDGNEAKPHSRPYMVSLQKKNWHICGGFLITKQFVLTAAHCWKEGEDLMVVVGAHELSKSKSPDRFRVMSYIKHPEYDSHHHLNDIMLLKLEKNVVVNGNVGLISLPKDGEVVKAYTLCSVAGWGRLWKNGPVSDRLMEAKTAIVNERECERRWESTYVASLMICIHGHGGTCNGDSGGPLVCNNTAVGLTSFGERYRCNSRLFPTVFTKISAHIKWIRTIIAKFE